MVHAQISLHGFIRWDLNINDFCTTASFFFNYQWMDGWTDRSTDGQIDGWIDEQKEGQADGQTDGRMEEVQIKLNRSHSEYDYACETGFLLTDLPRH